MYFRSGNVLFLILLAVSLFAALSYAVTQSSRSGGKNISDEDARLAASQITQYATLMEQTVSRLRLRNGCRDTQISFAADSDGDGSWYDTDDDYHNANAPSDFRCHVFHADGGRMHTEIPASPEFVDAVWFNGGNNVNHIGSDEKELVILLRLNSTNPLMDELCASFNELASVASDPLPSDPGIFVGHTFIGAYEVGASDIRSTNASSTDGFHTACLIEAEGAEPHLRLIYHVLIPR